MDDCETPKKRAKLSEELEEAGCSLSQELGQKDRVPEQDEGQLCPHPAYNDQGKHEIEVIKNNFESAKNWQQCTKNPGHHDFIPASKFAMDHLPEKFRDDDILRFIQLWSFLTVKLVTSATSSDRQPEDPFYKHRGTRFLRTGSGKVTDVYSYDSEDETCPCTQCSSSKAAVKKWAAVWIMTAMHVVYDDLEVSNTTAELFYDDEVSVFTCDLKFKLSGLRVVDFNHEGDWCKFECVTHDSSLAEQLAGALAPMMDLAFKIQDRFQGEEDLNLAVITSHPHGRAKYITVGEWKEVQRFERSEQNLRWTTYTYTTATCKGSSGAPVWVFGSDRRHMYAYYSHVHSEGGDPTLGEPNKSGAGDVVKTWEV